MKVILLERVNKLGQMGETVKVKDGYARNYLLPLGKALRANDANKQRFETERATRVFLSRISGRYPVDRAILFGSRARHTHSADSDADLAVVLKGERGKRSATAIEMAGIAFDVMLETGVLVEALPLWDGEMEHPEQFSNPALIRTIHREGIPL